MDLKDASAEVARQRNKAMEEAQGRSEGFALTGYDIPGCVKDGAWMLWRNSSVVAAVAHPGLGRG